MLEGSVFWDTFEMNDRSARGRDGFWIPIFQIDGMWNPAEIRRDSVPVVGGDGVRFSDAHYGPKAFTLSGQVRARTLRDLRAGQMALARAFDDLGSHSLRFYVWEVGWLFSICRKTQPLVMGEEQKDELFTREFTVGVTSEDSRSYSETTQIFTTDQIGSSRSNRSYGPQTYLGKMVRVYSPPSPSRWSYLQASGYDVVENRGSADTFPSIIVTGPISNPTLSNITTGKTFQWDSLEIQAGSSMSVDFGRRSVLRDGTLRDMRGIDFTQSDFWSLTPGTNRVLFGASNVGQGASVTMRWRDAYR